MKTLVASGVVWLIVAATAQAQTDGVERLSIIVEGATLSSPGGEQRTIGGGVEPSKPGVTARHGFSFWSDRCFGSVSRRVEPDADLGWIAEITPVRVVNDAVTFRLVWARTREEGKASTQPRRDVELTLRSGESIPLDAAQLRCTTQPRIIGTSLRVSVVRSPDSDHDRRLIALDLWLVEKLKDGSERSQPVSLRGLYHRPIPFYFESITEGALVLDIFGEVTAAPGDRTSEVKIMTRSRIFDPNPPPGRAFPRGTTATIKITPNEVVSVQLPELVYSAFASRALSLRIRVRQLR